MSKPADVLILSKDLYLSSQLHGAVQRAGTTGRTCLSQESCLEQLAGGGIKWVIADLEMADLDLRVLRSKAVPECRIVAFAPHMRTDLLSQAREAGSDLVLTRGQIVSRLDAILRGSSA